MGNNQGCDPNPVGETLTLDQELMELKKQNDKVWFNFDTTTPGIIFIKMLDCFQGHIDVNRLSNHILNQAKLDKNKESNFDDEIV